MTKNLKNKTMSSPGYPSTSRTVTMKKAENGYVISCYDDRAGKDKIKIAKDIKEAKNIAMSMMS